MIVVPLCFESRRAIGGPVRIDIPGRGVLALDYAALDFNGTIAVDGVIAPAVAERLERLTQLMEVHVLTADTFGTVRDQCAPFDVKVDVFPSGNAAESKRAIVAALPGGVCCFGNGYNDRLMFDEAALSICIVEREGASAALFTCADVIVTRSEDAFDLLLDPQRLIATLRG